VRVRELDGVDQVAIAGAAGPVASAAVEASA
jgi:hypothetical protein